MGRRGLCDARVPVALGVGAGELDAPAGGGEAQVRELDLRFGGDVHGAVPGELLEGEVEPSAFQESVDDVAVGLVEGRLGHAHGSRQPAEDLGVGQRVAGRVRGLDLRGESDVEVGGDEIVALQEARRGEDDVGEVGGVGREEVERDSEQVRSARALGANAPAGGWRRRC